MNKYQVQSCFIKAFFVDLNYVPVLCSLNIKMIFVNNHFDYWDYLFIFV